MNTDRFIKKLAWAKERVAEAQNTIPKVIGIELLRPVTSDIVPNRKAPTAIPTRIWLKNKSIYNNINNIF